MFGQWLCSVMATVCFSQAQIDGVELIVDQPEVEKFQEITNDYVKPNAWKYRQLLYKHVTEDFGSDKYLSFIAGLAMQEALWDCHRSSKYADGCMQFTPSTAKCAWQTFCRDLGKVRVEEPTWAYPCGIRYLAWLADRISIYNTQCDLLAFTAKSYNGGLGNVKKEQR